MGEAAGIGLRRHVRHDDERAGGERVAHPRRIRHRHRRVRCHDPQGLDPPFANGAKQIHRFQPRLLGDRGRTPETLHQRPVFRREVHMRGQRARQSANFAPAHRIGLAGDRERRGAGLADPPGRQMQVEDRIHLIGAGERLVDALAEHRHGARRPREQLIEAPHLCRRHIARTRHRPQVEAFQPRPEVRRNSDVIGQEGFVEHALVAAPRQRAVHQRNVAAGPDRQMQVRLLRRLGAARIDHHQLRARLAARTYPLIHDRVAPGGVRPHQHDQVRRVQIVIAGGHHILAKGAHMASHGAGHAQPRIGVDVRRSDEALHQLVGDVIILGQQLSRDVEGDAVWSVLRDRVAKALGDKVQRLVP